MTVYERALDLLGDVELIDRPNYAVLLLKDDTGPYVQVRVHRRDTITREMSYGYGARAHLSDDQTDSSILRTMFALIKAYDEHEVRESFTWRGRRIYGPHTDHRALWEAADQTESLDSGTISS